MNPLRCAIAIGIAAFLITRLASQTTLKVGAGVVDAQRISAHVRTLASDEFEGRAPGTNGEGKTVAYISSQFAAAGLQPGVQAVGKRPAQWSQEVHLTASEIVGPVLATAKTSRGRRTLTPGVDIVIRSTLLPVDRIRINAAPLVFVGYGVNSPERGWDDFKGIDLHGKLGIVLVNDPDFETDLKGRFDGKAMTYYGRWTYKFEEAARRGATGMLVIHETGPAGYGWSSVANSNTVTMFDIHRERPEQAHPLVEGWVSRTVAADLFRAAGLDFEAEKKKAQSIEFRPVPLENVSISVEYTAKHSDIVSSNLVAIVKGSTHPLETVIYTAHWDHLGIGRPDARGDRIYNGARDNALGVACLLELARLYASHARPERSVVFLATTAEERGLLGSEYYVQHPLYPLALTAAVYNIDSGNTFGPSKDVSLAGDEELSLREDLANAAARQGRRVSPDARPQDGLFFRADHFSFARAGVPAIFIRAGQELVEGGVTAGRAKAEDFVATRYHQPSDEWSPDWDLRGFAQDADLLYTLGREMANSRRWPRWLSASEFKTVRDATEKSRQK